jgi:hypothetical protein
MEVWEFKQRSGKEGVLGKGFSKTQKHIAEKGFTYSEKSSKFYLL